MNLAEMRAIVRRDLHDEDAANYRWTNDELDRHIAHALKEFSEALPHEQKATKATVADSREIDISTLTNRIMVEAVEYPVDNFPKRYQRFSLWSGIIILLGDEVPDGSNAYIYYGQLHSLITATAWKATTAYSLGEYVEPTTANGYRYECTTAGTSAGSEPSFPTTIGATVADGSVVWTCQAVTSTIPTRYEDLVVMGACGYAAIEWAAYAVNRVNVGGTITPREFLTWGKGRLDAFKYELKRLGRKNKVRARTLYKLYRSAVSKTTDFGP
jgi:hypothetical protein